MPDEQIENSTPIPVSVAKKYILKDLGASAEDVEEIKTNAEAEELMEYLKKKNAEDPEIKKKRDELKLKPNAGHQAAPLVDSEATPGSDHKLNLRDAMDRLSPRFAENQEDRRWRGDAMIMAVFDDDHPEGRCF